MYRILFAIFLMVGVSPLSAQTLDQTSSIFYPLPAFLQGKVFVAKQLFLGDEGGIWIHDIHGKVVFFDGQTILPRRGSVLPKPYQELVYQQGAFWTFIDNELYRTYPGGEPDLILSLTPGVVIKNIGASNGYLWLTDNRFFYSYHLEDGELRTLSLSKLYQLNQASNIIINDAVNVRNKWVLATNVGTYLSKQNQFTHITQSGKNAIESLFLSSLRNHLLVGTHHGALVIDIEHPDQVVKKIGNSTVFSMIETEEAYWIGTDNGLLIYSLSQDDITEFSGIKPTEYGLPGGKIYALVNDQRGGIWIATNKGIRYFSLFSQKLTRHFTDNAAQDGIVSSVKKLQPLLGSSHYLMLTHTGLFLLDMQNDKMKTLFYQGEVNDVQQIGQQLWIATDHGVVRHELSNSPLPLSPIPSRLPHNKTEFLTADQQGTLWGASGDQLWAYQTQRNHYVDFSQEWQFFHHSPLTITWLHASQKYGLLIGTEQGVYRLDNDQITYYKESAPYGSSLQVVEATNGTLWFLSEFGLFRFHSLNHPAIALPLVEDNLRLKCLLLTSQGLWLSSSQGITLYHFDGSIQKQIGAPYGLINNELETGICAASGGRGQETLLFSSAHGLIYMQAEEIADTPLPNAPIVLSQVSIDYQPTHIGGLSQQKLEVDYGKAISFHFGSASLTGNQRLEFRINHDDWQPFEGPHLTFDHLFPGEYRLSLRNQNEPTESFTWRFHVLKPWYFSLLACIGYLFIITMLIVLFIRWRARVMIRLNEDLRQQVALKTRQAQQQSKILVSYNQQLRKQVQVRQLWIDRWLVKSQSLLTVLTEKAATQQSKALLPLAQRMTTQFKQISLLNKGKVAHGMNQPLKLVLDTILEGWKHEFAQAGIQVECEFTEPLPDVCLKQSGLDAIFNAIFADVLDRLHPHQILSIKGRQQEEWIVVRIMDCAESTERLDLQMVTLDEDGTQTLHEAVNLTGGEFNDFSSPERNLIELKWPAHVQPTTDNAVNIHYAPDLSESHWLMKLDQIIATHYADPDFTTSTAASQMYVSERSLQRRFKNATGKTFKEYLTEYRLEQACGLLMSGEKISQVAFLCGFNDPSYFSQRFKLHFGLSPSQFTEDERPSSLR
ncbi:AraC family transcriptional regulator [Vibrio cincinnatiensis]|uniref:AraC family transcriptional regulator n=1 Tax=Vibrio cincinnatiensis TaxID=675 RepID=UPI001EDFF9A1|nr:AraC family transcriptional regulator [Vibrio cincinnatiensis]MCG3765757.1 AraC family transcriptional regulator [Vibrio cincinnatiensis]